MMTETGTETESQKGLVWNVKCRDCEASIDGKGLENLRSVEEFITAHAAMMNHISFEMDVYGFSILIQNVIGVEDGR